MFDPLWKIEATTEFVSGLAVWAEIGNWWRGDILSWDLMKVLKRSRIL